MPMVTSFLWVEIWISGYPEFQAGAIMIAWIIARVHITFCILFNCPGAQSFRMSLLHSRAVTHHCFSIRSGDNWYYTLQSRTHKIFYLLLTVNDVELPLVAKFLSETMFGSAVPNGQRNQLSRLELIELRDRFGRQIRRSIYPSLLLIAEDCKEIVG